MREDYRLRLRVGRGCTQKSCHSAPGGLTLSARLKFASLYEGVVMLYIMHHTHYTMPCNQGKISGRMANIDTGVII